MLDVCADETFCSKTNSSLPLDLATLIQLAYNSYMSRKREPFKAGQSFSREKDEAFSPQSLNWAVYFKEDAVASEFFMEDVEDLPVQEREQ